jgi:biotin carboxylase
MSNILQLGAGTLMIQSVIELKKLGFSMFLADQNPDAPAYPFSDCYRAFDIKNPEHVKQYAIDIKADVIIAVNEAGVYSAAKASQDLGLKNHKPESVKYFTDKGHMREKWKSEDLSQPNFIVVNSWKRIKKAIDDIGLPIILKPCLNWGSKGISLISEQDKIEEAINFAKNFCINERYIIEEFIPGKEMTIEGIVQNTELSILTYSDKTHQPHPFYRVAMSLNYPGNFEQDVILRMKLLIKNAVNSLEIIDGAIHAECMINDKGIYLIELAGRPGGGHIFSYIVKAASGISMPEALVRILLDENIDIKPRFQKGACYKFFTPPTGIFKKIKGIEEAKRLEGILDIGFNMKEGTLVEPISGDADRPGYIVSYGETREDAVKNADNAYNHFTFIMQ